MTNAVFLDSGIFIAFLNRRDQWHPQAVMLFDHRPSRWHTSFLVVSETYSWFLHRMGEEAARHFNEFLNSLEKLELLEITAGHHQAVLKMLDRFHGSKLTYVDASSLYFIDHHKISKIWSTDYHLSLMGAEVLPRR